MLKCKKLFKIARLCLVGIAVLSVSAMAGNIILISSFEELQKIGVDENYPLNGHYELTANIDISASREKIEYRYDDWRGWKPIGNSLITFGVFPAPLPDADSALYSGAFTGTFDGKGYTISGLHINRAPPLVNGEILIGIGYHLLSLGLFGALDGAVVKNLFIETDTISTIAAVRRNSIGALAGYSRNSVIINVHSDGVLRGSASQDLTIGGLVGISTNDSISGSSSDVTIAANADSAIVGGLVGISRLEGYGRLSAVIENSSAAVTIIGSGKSAGGLVGENIGVKITKSSANTASALILFQNFGGLVGLNSVFITSSCPYCDNVIIITGTIIQSYSSVNVSANPNTGGVFFGELSNMGGLVGFNAGGEIDNCYSTGILTLNNSVSIAGGLVGVVERPRWESIKNSYAAVRIEGGDINNRGGLTGRVNSLASVIYFSSSYWDENVAGPVGAVSHGTSANTIEMGQQSTFTDWDFENIWRISDLAIFPNYPFLVWRNEISTSISRDHTVSSISKNRPAPTVTVRGKVLNVKTLSPAANLQIRLVDMKGRTLTRFNTTGSGSFPLSKISAGRYLVEVRDMESGKRFTSSIILR
ncbi:MAG: hypothetical protein FWE57_10910 [Chitinispirillia bacterium]|nr:hypothetical protein [Chitinispirillia bacterium]